MGMSGLDWDERRCSMTPTGPRVGMAGGWATLLPPVTSALFSPTSMNTHSMRAVSAHIDGLDHEAVQTGSTYNFADVMTSEDRHLLLESWQRIGPDADRLATVFFDRLFELNSGSRRLFAGSTLESRFLQFAYMLVELVALHGESHDMRLAAKEMRQCLSRYGIADAQFFAVSQAASAVLSHAPEVCASPESRLAWHEAHDLLTAIIQRAAGRRATAEWLARAS